MRAIIGLIVLAALSGCTGEDISLEDLYKRAEAASRPPPPPPKVDNERERWSTAALLGWNSVPKDGGEIIQDMMRRHASHAASVEAEVSAPKEEKKQKPKPVTPKAKVQQVMYANKVKAVKAKLVKKGITKKVKKAKKPHLPSVSAFSSPEISQTNDIVPETEHATMLSTHIFDAHKKAKEKEDDIIPGIPSLTEDAPAHSSGNSLTAMASDLLSEVDKKDNDNAEVAHAKEPKAKEEKTTAKVVKQKHEEESDPFRMDLSSEPDTETTQPTSEKKLPPLGAFLGSIDDDDSY